MKAPKTLLGLLQHYSPSGEEARAVEYLVGRMRTLGFGRAFRDEAGNAVGTLGDGPRQVMLLGHIDTVAGELEIKLEGDELHGRGAVDAKGPLAAFVDAAAKVGLKAGWQCVVVGAVDEERDSLGARHIVEEYRPDYAIIGEPSRWDRITVAYKGSAWAEASVSVPQTHSAGRESSAAERAVAFWGMVQQWAEDYNEGKAGAFNQLLPSLRGMTSGEEGLQSWAALRLGFRLPPALPPERFYEQLAQRADGLKIEPSGYPIPAFRANKKTPLVRALLGAIRSVGGKPGFVSKTGTSDMNVVGPAWDCPIVSYGPGDSKLDHTPNERISLQEYGLAVEVLAGVLERLLS